MKGSDAKCPAEVEKKEPSSATIKPKDEDGTVFTCLVFNLNVFILLISSLFNPDPGINKSHSPSL